MGIGKEGEKERKEGSEDSLGSRGLHRVCVTSLSVGFLPGRRAG